MADIRDQFDGLIAGLNRISLARQLGDKFAEADEAGRRECGACQHWMKSSACPREHNVNGRQRGPSMSGFPCEKFVIKQWVVDLQAKRILEAVEFATKHNLPVPSRYRDAVGGSNDSR